MWALLRAPIKSVNTRVLWWSEGIQGGPELSPQCGRETWSSRMAVGNIVNMACHITLSARTMKFSNINDAFKQVIAILVNWHISTAILTRIARVILVKIPVEICKFTRIPMTCLNVSCMLLNFSRSENFYQCQQFAIKQIAAFVHTQRTEIVFPSKLEGIWLY